MRSSLIVLTVIVFLTGCNQAKSPELSAVENQEKQFKITSLKAIEKAIDKKVKDAVDDSVKNGGIFMRRSDEFEWKPPTEEIDNLKDQLYAMEEALVMTRKMQISESRAKQVSMEKSLLAQKEVFEKKLAELEVKRQVEVDKEQEYLDVQLSDMEEALKMTQELQISESTAKQASMEKGLLAQKEVFEKKLAELEVKRQAKMDENKEYMHAVEERMLTMISDTALSPNDENDGAIKTLKSVETAKIEVLSKDGETITTKISKNPTKKKFLSGGGNPADWIDIRSYQVVVHEDSKTLEDMVNDVLAKAEPFTGPWEVKWKLKDEHQDVLNEKFGLDAETTFSAFASYLSNYMRSYRGFGLTFNIFEAERVMVITE